MKICARYSFNNGIQAIHAKHPNLLPEIEEVIAKIDASACKTKKSREKTMPGRMLFNPKSLNKAFKKEFYDRQWQKAKVKCDYPTSYYTKKYKPKAMKGDAFREMDFVKEGLGVEVYFGKCAFMVYSGCAKMTIFSNLGFIDAGLEIVPIKEFANQMSTGVSYFEQFVWDLQKRGVSNIDIPVLILGIDV